MNNIRNKLIRDQIIFDDENNPSTSMADIIWSRTVLDAVFDQTDKDEITLRKILEDMKEEIKNSGTGYIRFPVTSVNGMYDDVIITKEHINLGRVNNTADMEKPLSDPQRNDIMTILANYDFGIDLSDMIDHMINHNNPHEVTLNQLNTDGSVDNIIGNHITNHDISGLSHLDIRNSINDLGDTTSNTLDVFDDRITNIVNNYSEHLTNPLAHSLLFLTKEDITNKATSFSDIINYNNNKYPSTKAVVDYISNVISNLDIDMTDDYIANLDVVATDSVLPLATSNVYRRAYLIKNRIGTNNSAIAVCKKNGNDYVWDIQDFSISKYDPQYFELTPNGLSLNIPGLPVSGDVYTKGDSDEKFLQMVDIIPGTENGSLNLIVNTETEIVNKNVHVAGLKNLAYKDIVGSEEIGNGAIQSYHLGNESVGNDQLSDYSITNSKLTGLCVEGYNIMDRTIEGYKIADRTITGNQIDYYTITHEQLAEGSINNTKMQQNSVSTGNIIDKAITGAKIADVTVSNANIVNNTLANDKLAQMVAYTIKGNMSSVTATPTDVSLSSLTDTVISRISTAQLTLLGSKLIPYGYQHPANHPASIITQDANNRFVTDAEKTNWNSKAAGTHSHAYLPLTGGTITGNLTVNGTITGSQVFNAVWNNDIAELFKKDDINEIFNPGDIIEINPDTGNYRKSKNLNSRLVVGILSDQYGYLLGGDEGVSLEDNLKKYIPVGLAGRLNVNVIGPVLPGDLIASSNIPGVGIVSDSINGCIIAKALEYKYDDGIGKVKVLIMNR